MSFARPEYLAAIPIVLGLLALGILLRWKRLRRVAVLLGSPAAARVMPADALAFPAVSLSSMLAAGLAMCLAAAGPGETPVSRSAAEAPLDIAIVVDASVSMAGTDVAPSRIDRARAVVSQIAETAPDGRIGLLVMGDWLDSPAPPSGDHRIAGYFARALNTQLLADLASAVRTSSGDRGAGVAAAIDQARAALGRGGDRRARKVILLISDGAIPGDEKEALAAAGAAAKAGIKVWTASVGASSTTMLELDGRPLLDAGGDPMPAEFNPRLLRAIAKAGGGTFENVNGDAGLHALTSGLRAVAGLSGAEDAIPQRLSFALVLLAILLLVLATASSAGRMVALPRWWGRAA